MSMASVAASGPVFSRRSRFRDFAARFADSKVAVAALAVLALILLAAFLSPWIAPTDPYDLVALDILDSRLPPGSTSATGMVFWLGTDGQGRDLLSAILYGLRLSILVGVLSGFFAFVVGTSIGLVSATAGGRVDSVLMRIVDLQLSFPPILVALVLLAALGRGVDKVVLALIIVQWAYYCRTARASALVERHRDYMEAARGLKLGRFSILFGHLLPNCISPLLVVANVQVANSIALESTLSFLGVGLPPTEPSLGLLIANGFQFALSGVYWITLFPGIALVLLIGSINLVGDHLRDVLNPRLQA
jgi:peptide/nickel transport system permease protein